MSYNFSDLFKNLWYFVSIFIEVISMIGYQTVYLAKIIFWRVDKHAYHHTKQTTNIETQLNCFRFVYLPSLNFGIDFWKNQNNINVMRFIY